MTWTLAKLQQRIASTAEQIRRLDEYDHDRDVEWMRSVLEKDLAQKRRLLHEMLTSSAA